MDSRYRGSSRKRSNKRRHTLERRKRSPSSDVYKASRSRSRSYNRKHRKRWGSRSSRSRSDSYSSRRNRRHKVHRSKNSKKHRYRYSSSSSYSSSESRSYSKRRHRRSHSEVRKKKRDRGKDKAKKAKHSSSTHSTKKAKHKHSSSAGKDRSQDAGHYKYKLNEIIKKRYQITRHISDGTFGRVFDALNLEDNKHYAMKIIRAVPRYIESAKIEADILKNIRSKDPENRFHFVELKEAFNMDANYCMVLKSSPENILLCTSKYRTVNIPEIANCSKNEEESDERSSTKSRSKEKAYLVPVSDDVKIIDFGGATYDHEHHSSIINTRQYRAPEVILGCCNWSTVSDLWSIGCIVAELYTGDLFFETHESYEHLAMIEKNFGPIPFWMANRCEKKLADHFDTSEETFRTRGTYFNWPNKASGPDSIKRVNDMKTLDEIIRPEHKELMELLRKLLTIDPKERISCQEALKHEFFSKEYEKEY